MSRVKGSQFTRTPEHHQIPIWIVVQNYFRRIHVRSGAKRTVIGGAALAAVALLALPATAMAGQDVPGTANITLGGLTMTTPVAVGFTGVLTGVDQVVNTAQALDIVDARGSGAGWNVTLTSTQFVTATVPVKSLPTAASSDVSVISGCDVGVTCTLGDNTLVTYPIAIPAGATAPTAIKIQTAAVNSGLGGQTWTHTMALALAGNTKVGAYTSTWTYSLTSAP